MNADPISETPQIRITVVTGFLGSGKTTLLRRLLADAENLSLGVIVNDMSELEVDGDLLRDPEKRNEELGNFVSIHSGSISGPRQLSFASVVDDWKGRRDLDHLIIETSGSTHPWPLIQEVAVRREYRLEIWVTLIDARMLKSDLESGRMLLGTREGHLALMIDQVKVASHILLTKTEKLSSAELSAMANHLESINPEACLFAVNYGRISFSKLLNSGQFNRKRANQIAQPWRKRVSLDAADFGIGSTVVSDPRPLHPKRLWTLFREGLGSGIHRSKGFIWLPSRDRDVLLWNQAAGSIELELSAYWKAALVKNPDGKLVPEEIAALQGMLEGTHPVFGDRACDLTLIGKDLDRQIFAEALRECFCTDDEIRHWEQGGEFEDPWPKTFLQV